MARLRCQATRVSYWQDFGEGAKVDCGSDGESHGMLTGQPNRRGESEEGELSNWRGFSQVLAMMRAEIGFKAEPEPLEEEEF
jgi:hypothetical protein